MTIGQRRRGLMQSEATRPVHRSVVKNAPSANRREVMKYVAGLGSAVTAAAGLPAATGAQDNESGLHPLVGTWLAQYEETPDVEGILVFHEDGVHLNFFPLDATTGMSGTVAGSWSPTGPDSGQVTKIMIAAQDLREVFRTVYREQVTVSEDGDQFTGWYEHETDGVVDGPFTLAGTRVVVESMVSEIPDQELEPVPCRCPVPEETPVPEGTPAN